MKPTGLMFVVCAIFILFASPIMAITFSNVTSYANLDHFQLARCSAWLDYNRDGFQDLIVGSEYGYNRLHRNEGDGTFSEVTQEMGISHRTGVWGVNIADINNDGYQEIYLSTRAPDTMSAGRNVLLLNCDTCFVDISDASGANVPGGGVAACFAPFDKDAYIDLFVPNQYYPDMEYPHLLINISDNTFSDQTVQYGLNLPDWWDVPAVFDFNNDHALDLFCTKDYHGNSMYRATGHSEFEDITDGLNIQTPCGYGVAVGDVNNDGWLDLYVTNWHYLTDNLFIYDTSGQYVNMTQEWNVPGNIWTSAPQFADFDNDGWLDLVVMAAGEGNKYYRNCEGTHFEDNTQITGFTNTNYNWGASTCDYDNDGFIDIYMPEYIHSTNGGRLYRNNGNENNWTEIELVGVHCNRDAIGARLWLFSPNSRQTRQILAGAGFGSQNSLIQHFGLGQDSTIGSLEIWWPSGGIDVYTNLPANQYLRIVQDEAVYIRDEIEIALPEAFKVGNAYPNPFNAVTMFEIEVFIASSLTIEVIDLLGRKIKTLMEDRFDPGLHRCYWDGSDFMGRGVTSGTYFIRASNGIKTNMKKVTLIK